MTPTIPSRLRARVVDRAQNRCEYCGLSQDGQEATFHVDHVIPRAADGTTDEQNLALACVGCSLRKGARRSAVDPETGAKAPLFDPRREEWHEHFRIDDFVIVGTTATGRATVEALGLNRPMLVAIREEETLIGRPPVR